LQAQAQVYQAAPIDGNSYRWFFLLLQFTPYLSLYTLKVETFDIFQAYIMELEAEVAKLKENNEELQKKQVYLKLL
jgi:hypothetical protein